MSTKTLKTSTGKPATAAELRQQDNREKTTGKFATQQREESILRNLGESTSPANSTPADVIRAALKGDPDLYVEDLCESAPGLAPGKARTILHDYADHLHQNPNSQWWQRSLAEQLAKVSSPTHPSFVMRSSNDVRQKLSWAVEYAIEKGDSESVDRQRRSFHEMVPHVSVEDSDSAFDTAFALKKVGLENWDETIDAVLKENDAVQGNTFDYDYVPPGSNSVESDSSYRQGGTLMGENFTKYRSITDINKDIRAELKRAQVAGYLPKVLKFGVRGSSYSGGQSTTISIKGADTDALHGEPNTWNDRPLSELGQDVRDRVSGIINSFNYDDSNSQVDYFNTLFYSHVTFES